MKIFAIRDKHDNSNSDLAYLFYYKSAKRFFIEIPDDINPWDLPILLSSFAENGERVLNSYWSMKWVRQRIVPIDRQNIDQILKDNGLDEYDEFSLLMLSMGRCSQDECYLVPIMENQISKQIQSRFPKRITDVVPLNDYNVLVFFRDGTVKRCDLKKHFRADRVFSPLLNKEEYFFCVNVQPGGYGIEWDVNIAVTDTTLNQLGEQIPLSDDAFKNFLIYNVVNAAEAAEIIGCSRQNIGYLANAGKIVPVKSSEKNTLYLKSDIVQQSW